MAFFAQTGPTAEARLSQMLGQSMAQGATRNFATPETMVAENRLRSAMGNIPEGATLLETLKAIGPEMMTTPQGAPLLESLLQMQQRETQSKAMLDYFESLKSRKTPQQKTGEGNLPPTVNKEEVNTRRGAKPPSAEMTPFPKQTIVPEPIKMPTADEINDMRADVASNMIRSTGQADMGQVEGIINQRLQSMQMQNQEVEKQRQNLIQGQDKLVADGMMRAENEKLFEHPTDNTVFETALNEAKAAENPIEAYKYAREKTNQYQTTRNAITRQLDNPGFFTKIARQAIGTHKEKDQLIADLQPQLQDLISKGYRREARELLTNDIGLGPEDAERALFPLTQDQEKAYSSFSKSPKPIFYGPNREIGTRQENVLTEPQLNSFKNELVELLQNDPDANLIALRGDLMFNKNYTWQDISKALHQAINEGLWEPDPIQKEQLPYVSQSPLPGLAQQFKHFWTGSK